MKNMNYTQTIISGAGLGGMIASGIGSYIGAEPIELIVVGTVGLISCCIFKRDFENRGYTLIEKKRQFTWKKRQEQ